MRFKKMSCSKKKKWGTKTRQKQTSGVAECPEAIRLRKNKTFFLPPSLGPPRAPWAVPGSRKVTFRGQEKLKNVEK